MGRILCEKHGRSPMELVCSHLAATTTMPTHCHVTLELDGLTTDIRCCEPCATTLRTQSISSAAELDVALGDTTPVCAVCMSEQY